MNHLHLQKISGVLTGGAGGSLDVVGFASAEVSAGLSPFSSSVAGGSFRASFMSKSRSENRGLLLVVAVAFASIAYVECNQP